MNKLLSIDELQIKYIAPEANQGVGLVDYGKANEFEPIGIGLPLIIRLHTVYVGNLANTIFDLKKSILVTSQIKDDITYDAAPKAVNQIFKPARDRETLYMRSSNQGSEILYYSAALDNNKLKVEIEAKADKFNQELFTNISNGLGSASGLPIFIPYAPYMVVGGQLFKVAGEFLNKMLEKVPVLNYSFDITNEVGGLINAKSDFLIGGNFDELQQLAGYDITHDTNSIGNIFLSKDGVPYKGDIPYVIISLDGRSNHVYEKFKPVMASAALLKKYHGISDKSNLDNLQDMVTLYNDYSYLKKSRDLSNKLQGTLDKETKEQYKKLLEAYKANVSNEDIKKLLDSPTV